MNNKYQIFKKFKEKDLNNFASLTKENYSSNHFLTDKNIIAHKYLDYPYQSTFISTLSDNEKVQGRICYVNNEIIYNKKKLSALTPQDFVINKKYRSPFTNIIKLINIPKRIQEKEFVIHTGNENSNKLYDQILKYPKYFKIEVSLILLNPFFFIKKAKLFRKVITKFYSIILYNRDKKIKFKKEKLTNNDLKKLNNWYPEIPRFIRTEEFFHWRLANIKFDNIKIYQDEKLKGYFILAHLEYKNKKMSLIFDYFVNKTITKHEMRSVIFEIVKLAQGKSDFIFLSGNNKSCIYNKIKLFPFIKIPRKFLPHSSYFYGRKSNKSIKKIEFFHHTLIDQDWF